MTTFDDIFEVLAKFPEEHVRPGAFWRVLDAAAGALVAETFQDSGEDPRPFGPFGPLAMPYFEMGNITSLQLFGLDELILFAFYHANRQRYRKVVDFGANIGLHTMVLRRCGFEVRSFEPDPVHLAQLTRNLDLNGLSSELIEAAVSLEDGEAEFVRVKGNTTGSHIAGAKENPYGELDRYPVRIVAAVPHLAWADLAKIDIEGHEAALITGLSPMVWADTDAVLEIGTEQNAREIFEHLDGSDTNIFTQKTGWQAARRTEDMPFSHRDGSAFLSAKAEMPWR